MAQDASDLRLPAAAADRRHQAGQGAGIDHEAGGAALVEAAEIDELNLEAGARGGGKHLALQAAGEVPGGLTAHGRVEGEGEAGTRPAVLRGRELSRLVEEGVDRGAGHSGRGYVLAAHAAIMWARAPAL